MTFYVNSGTRIKCSFGTTPGSIQVFGRQIKIGGQPVANIMDNRPIVNIQPCGMCRSLGNPVVASATAAAFGALTPMPCLPNTSAAPWMPGNLKLLVKGKPALLSTDKLMCVWGGIIQIDE